MPEIVRVGETVIVRGRDHDLTYRPRGVTLSDGGWVAHESRGGFMSSVWAVDLGDRFVEVVHLGHGPSGGELVVVVPNADTVLIGDLYTPTLDDTEPDGISVKPSWPAAVDLVLGMTRPTTTILATSGPVEREDLADFHQALLGRLHG